MFSFTAEPRLVSQGLSNTRAIYQPIQGDWEHWDGQLLRGRIPASSRQSHWGICLHPRREWSQISILSELQPHRDWRTICRAAIRHRYPTGQPSSRRNIQDYPGAAEGPIFWVSEEQVEFVKSLLSSKSYCLTPAQVLELLTEDGLPGAGRQSGHHALLPGRRLHQHRGRPRHRHGRPGGGGDVLQETAEAQGQVHQDGRELYQGQPHQELLHQHSLLTATDWILSINLVNTFSAWQFYSDYITLHYIYVICIIVCRLKPVTSQTGLSWVRLFLET